MTERAKRCGTCGAWAWRRSGWDTVEDQVADCGDAKGDCRRSHLANACRSHDEWCLDWVPREAGDGGE